MSDADPERPIRIYSTHDYIDLQMMRQALESAGVRCVTEGEKLLIRWSRAEMYLLVSAADQERAVDVIQELKTANRVDTS